MSDSPQAVPGQLVDIGSVAAANVVQAIGGHPDSVPAVKRAIADEINAMSSHFTLAFADIQTQYEAAVYQAKLEYQKAISAFSYVKANVRVVIAVGAVVFCAGVLIGHFVR